MERELVEWLQGIVDRAGIEAYRARTEGCQRADAETFARTWESLDDH